MESSLLKQVARETFLKRFLQEGDVADRVAGVLVDDEALGAADDLHEPLRVLERGELVELAGHAEIRRADLFGVAFPRHALAEVVELSLVDDPGHVHEAHLEGG